MNPCASSTSGCVSGSAYACSSTAAHSATVTLHTPTDARPWLLVWKRKASSAVQQAPRETKSLPSSFGVGLNAPRAVVVMEPTADGPDVVGVRTPHGDEDGLRGGKGRPDAVVVDHRARRPDGPDVLGAATPNGIERIAGWIPFLRPTDAVVVEDRPRPAHRPDVRAAAAPHRREGIGGAIDPGVREIGAVCLR
jgi:hypothetical protein